MTVSPNDNPYFGTVRLAPSPEAIKQMEAIHAKYGNPCKIERVSGSFGRRPDGTFMTQAEVDDFFVDATRREYTLWMHTTFWPESRPVWKDVRYNAKRMLRRHPLHFARHFRRFLWQWATWRKPDYLENTIPMEFFRPANVPPKE